MLKDKYTEVLRLFILMISKVSIHLYRLKAKKILVEEPEDELRYESWSHPRQEEFANR